MGSIQEPKTNKLTWKTGIETATASISKQWAFSKAIRIVDNFFSEASFKKAW